MAYIQVDGLYKEFRSSKRIKGSLLASFKTVTESKVALNHISFEINKNDCVGYIGPNGAGKSTTIRILCGLLFPTNGHVSVNGVVPWSNREKYISKIGMMFGNKKQLWDELSLKQNFELLKKIYSIEKGQYQHNVDYFISLLGLEDILHRPLRELSLGQRARCEFSAAFLHNPEIVFLDEATIGLDFDARNAIKAFLLEIKHSMNTTIIYTSHDLREIEEVCDRLIVINKGDKLFDGSVEDIRREYNNLKNVSVSFLSEELANEAKNNIPKNLSPDLIVNMDKNVLTFKIEGNSRNFLKLVAGLSSLDSMTNLVVEDQKLESIVGDILKKNRN